MKKNNSWVESESVLLEENIVNRKLPANIHLLSKYWQEIFNQITIQKQVMVRLMEGGPVEIDTDAIMWTASNRYHLEHHEWSEIRMLTQKVMRWPTPKEIFTRPRGEVKRTLKYLKHRIQKQTTEIVPDDRPALLFWDNRCTSNVFHWFVDALARLSLFDVSVKKSYLLVPEQALKRDYVLQTLNSFGFSLEDLIILKTGVRYRLSRVQAITPAIYSTGGCCQLLVQSVQKKLIIKDFDCTELVYLARKPELGRKIVNNDEVDVLLSQYGFQKIYPEDYSFRDLLLLLGKTKVMVSIYSASLGHSILMPSGGSVIEIAAEDFIGQTPLYWEDKYPSQISGDYYYSLSVACGLHYYLVPCKKENPDAWTLIADIHVDLNLARQTIDLALSV